MWSIIALFKSILIVADEHPSTLVPSFVSMKSALGVQPVPILLIVRGGVVASADANVENIVNKRKHIIVRKT